MDRAHPQRPGHGVSAFRRDHPFAEAGAGRRGFREAPPSPEPRGGSRNHRARVHRALRDSANINPWRDPADGVSGRRDRDPTAHSNSLFGEILFPVYVGVIVWGGIYLRDERLRTLVPWRQLACNHDGEKVGRCRIEEIWFIILGISERSRRDEQSTSTGGHTEGRIYSCLRTASAKNGTSAVRTLPAGRSTT